MEERKLQIALEFMLVYTFAMTIFIILFVIIATRTSSLFNQQVYSQIEFVAQQAAQQIDSAVNAGNGYSSNILLQTAYGINPYNITILANGEVIVTAQEASQKAQSIAFSQAKSLLLGNVLNTGSMIIQNFMGLICVDASCPSPFIFPSMVFASSQSVHVAQFNGQGSSISYPVPAAPITGITITGWVQTAWNNEMIYQLQSGGTPLIYLEVGATSAGGASGQLVAYLRNNAGTLLAPLNSGKVINNGAYHFIALTWNGITATTYVDGQPAGSAGFSGTLTMTTPYVGCIGMGASSSSACAGTNPFNGVISDIQVYNTSLSANQIALLYSSGISGTPLPSPANIIAWWPLNGNAYDYSGRNETGTASASVQYPAASRIGITVDNSTGNPAPNALVGFVTTLGNFTNAQFGTNYTNANGVAYAFLNQNLTGGVANVSVAAYPGNYSTQNSLVGWWPLSEGFVKSIQTYSASGANPPSLPSGISYYVPVNIINSQSSNTQANFQQAVYVDSAAYSQYEASNLQNINFFYYNGVVINSWLEGNVANEGSDNLFSSANTLYWLNIGPQIGASNSLMVYMGFAPITTNLFNTATTGEAPQLSPAYGQYDTGASVFPYYWDFAGTSLPSGWVSGTSPGPGNAATVNDGITLTSNSVDGSYAYAISTTPVSNSNSMIVDSLDAIVGGGGNSGFVEIDLAGYFSSYSGLTLTIPPCIYTPVFSQFKGMINGQISDGSELYVFDQGSCTGTGNTARWPPLAVYSTAISNNTIAPPIPEDFAYYYYILTGSMAASAPSPSYIGLGTTSGTTGEPETPSMTTYWTRARFIPPSGVMPSAVLGSVYGSAPSVIYDLSGTGATGTGTILSMDTKSPSGVIFGGKSSQIRIPVNSISSNALYILPQDTGFTATMDVYLGESQVSEASSAATLFSTSPLSKCGYNLIFMQSNVIAATDVCGHSYSFTYPLTAGALYNLAVTLSPGSSPTETYYLNGMEVAHGTSGAWASSNAWNSLCIGSACGQGYFDGEISDLQLYDSALTPAQVYELYARRVPTYSLSNIPLSTVP